MNISNMIIILFVFLSFFTSLYSKMDQENHKKKSPNLKGEYLGQPRPGLIPQVFSPGIISAEMVEHGSLVFSTQGKEVYWSRVSRDFKEGAIWVMVLEDGKWSKPKIAPFSKKDFRDLCPVFSPDGKKLFFTSRRPINGQVGYNLWITHKDASGWSIPKPLNPVINDGHQSGCCLDKDNNLYFMSWVKDDPKTCDLYVSRLVDGKYIKAENMGKQINSTEIESTPFISPDNKYIVFCSMNRSDGMGGFDLYLSFKRSNGSWAKAVNMGSIINSTKNEWFPSISPDGKYFFFISNKTGNDDYYWVDARVIEKLKPKDL